MRFKQAAQPGKFIGVQQETADATGQNVGGGRKEYLVLDYHPIQGE